MHFKKYYFLTTFKGSYAPHLAAAVLAYQLYTELTPLLPKEDFRSQILENLITMNSENKIIDPNLTKEFIYATGFEPFDKNDKTIQLLKSISQCFFEAPNRGIKTKD